MFTDLALLLTLFVLNGVFALSEIAIVSSRRARLLQLVDNSNAGAARALVLASEPTRFLSTVQVGITSIGILSGAIGEAVIADPVRVVLEQSVLLAPHAAPLSLGIMVVVLTYFSLIIGELVPKRLALTRPESFATMIAGPMSVLSRVARPLVYLLSVSTDAVLHLLGVRKVHEPAVTVEEFKVLMEQGTEEGVFEPSEHEIVTNVLNLDDRHVAAILTPRSDVIYLDVDADEERVRQTLIERPHTVLPVSKGGLEHVVGFVRSKSVLVQLLEGRALDLQSIAEPPLFVPHTMTLMRLLEQFKRTHLPVALVVDEHGAVDGLVSLTDVISAIVGDLPGEPGEEPLLVQREDGSWLVDGAIEIDTLQKAIGAPELADEDDRRHYHTLGGLAMLVLGRVPRTADAFERGGYRFEIVDMDGNRVDRVLVSRLDRGTER